MAGNELQQSMGDSDKCPICLETCQELKTLNCQHSFCLHCLQDWMKKKGALECPICRQMHTIPEGGLQDLPSNALDTETAEHLVEGHGNNKCYCGKDNAEFYCQECHQYLCSFCKKSHEFLPALKNHTLQPINTTATGGPEPLHLPMCPLHEKELEFYCKICKIPICQKCTVTDHREDKGQHEPIRASDAFKDFKTTAMHLMFATFNYEQRIKLTKDKCLENASNLEYSRNSLKKEIHDALQEIVNLVKVTGMVLYRKLDDVYKTKKETTDSQVEELNNILLDVKDKQDVITTLLESDEATALQTCQQAIKEMQERIHVLPDAEPRDDGKVYFSPTKDHILNTLKIHGIGSISEKPDANMFEVVSVNPMTVTRWQPFHIKIAERYKCEIDYIEDLTVSKIPNRRTIRSCPTTRLDVFKEANGEYFAEGSSSEDLVLRVKFCNYPIKGSPINIIVESEKIVRSIVKVGQSTGYGGIKDLLMSDNGSFFIAWDTSEVSKFENSGAFISKIQLSNLSRIHRICKLKNNKLIFFDWGNRNITFCTQCGLVIKSIPTGEKFCQSPRYSHHDFEFRYSSSGMDVNESLNLVYVADQTANCVHAFNMESSCKVKTIGYKGGLEGELNEPSGVAITKEGNLIVADMGNHRLQLFGTNGRFIKVLIGGGSEDGMVIAPSRVDVDNDDNIIVVSKNKVQLFDNRGKFIRVIQQSTHKQGESDYFAISIVSHFPRRLALAKFNSSTIDIINY